MFPLNLKSQSHFGLILLHSQLFLLFLKSFLIFVQMKTCLEILLLHKLVHYIAFSKSIALQELKVTVASHLNKEETFDQ